MGVLAEFSVEQIRRAIDSFPAKYVYHWAQWMSTPPSGRRQLFGEILRRWQAVRPLPLRRLSEEAAHDPPYLDDLVAEAQPSLSILAHTDMARIAQASPSHLQALRDLWRVFLQLPARGSSSEVGITKAVLLLTEGRIGPALDSTVRTNLGIGRVLDAEGWIDVLRSVGEDIGAVESRHAKPFRLLVPDKFSRLEVGRLYDMALGPRDG